MHRFRPRLFCVLTLPVLAAAQAHAPAVQNHLEDSTSPSHAAPKDYSQEPFVIEKYATVARFENDGTGERDLLLRVRIQSGAGAQQWSTLVFNYVAPNERLDVRYVHVRREDGSTLAVAPEAIKIAPSPVTRDAPAFANLEQMRVAVPSLSPGTVLEYEVVERSAAPPAPGEFWFEYRFARDAIVLDEELEINVPRNHALKIVSPNLRYLMQAANGRSIYRWKRANLANSSAANSEEGSPSADVKPPDVMLSTFPTWDAIARWYGRLQNNASQPAPEIRAKAKELVANHSTQLDKIEALYDFVAKQIRYINLPFGAVSYQPHSAAEVLENKYGDAQDKQALLAALLRAEGISSDVALIPSARRLDTALPSPAQFDRLVTAVPMKSRTIWLDTSSEVIPFEMLPASLRHKSALLVSFTADGASGRLAETPTDPPFPSSQHVEITGRVDELGKLTAQARYTLRGDTELLLRTAFHQAPPAQWNQLAQTILTLDGLRGELTSVKPSDPTSTRDPFQLELDFTQLDFLDWRAKQARVALPLLTIGLPDPADDKTQPIDLGNPLDVTVQLNLDLPPNFTAQPPVGISVSRDYAEFKSSYRFDALAHSISATRSVNFKMRELPASRKADYLAFSHAVSSDQAQPLAVENMAPAATVPPSASADDLLDAGNAALHDGNVQSALPLLKRAVEIAPTHKGAWNDLGRAYLQANQLDEAASAFRKQLEVNPADEHAYDYLGLALERQQKYDDAADAFRKQIQANPLDPAAHAALGEIFMDQHRYPEAAPELEKATILSPENGQLQVTLGRAYLNIGVNDKALAAFDKGASLSPTPATWNDIAYFLADASVSLDKAQQYAQSALSAAAANLQDANLSHVTTDQMRDVARLGAYWDTLGWVDFKRGETEKARSYIEAAWRLDQGGEIGDHLAQVTQKLEGKQPAIHAFALALAAPEPDPDTRARLTLLLGGNAQIDSLVSSARPELEALRVIPAGKLLDEAARADFLILLSPGGRQPRVEDVRFLTGSERLRALAPRLRSLDFGPMFPDASPLKIIRRATLACPGSAAACRLTLIPAGSVLAAN
jgi:tetratricopeptide (TPR) repeat protein/transglutaminase-like putative cysteine protease